MITRWKWVIGALATLCMTGPVGAASIIAEYNDAGKYASIIIVGRIEAGDDLKFKNVVVYELRRGYWIGRIHLFSIGGNVAAALSIGEQIRLLRAVTASPSQSETGYRECRSSFGREPYMSYNVNNRSGDSRCDCFSACFLIWSAGTGKEGNVLGVHAIKFPPGMFAQLSVDEARALYNRSRREVTEYLQKMDVPERIIGLMWANSSAEARYLKRDELEVFPRFETVIEEMKLARCGDHPGGSNPSSILTPYYACINSVHEENSRAGGREYLRAYGGGETSTPPSPPRRGAGGPYVPAVPPSPPPQASSIWDHNGSAVYLVSRGTERRFFYEIPRDGLRGVGVEKGTLLFEGWKQGQRYVGRAYIFSSHCPPTPYDVAGDVSANDEQVTLHGSAPRLNASCEIIGYRDDTLVFRYSRTAAR